MNKNLPKAFKASEQSESEWVSDILNLDRLKVRVAIFSKYVLPNIEQAVNNGFCVRHLVAASVLLPDEIKSELDLLCKKYDWLAVRYVSYDEVFSFPEWIKKEVFSEGKKKGGFGFYVCRLDDDDVLSLRFFEEVGRFLKKDNSGKVLTLPNGYSGKFDKATGKYEGFVEIHEECIAIGLGVVNYYNAEEKSLAYPSVIPRGSHKKVFDNHSVIFVDCYPCYIRSLHETNDSYYQRLGGDNVRVLDEFSKGCLIDVSGLDKSFIV